jgi:outer membrane protein TolC
MLHGSRRRAPRTQPCHPLRAGALLPPRLWLCLLLVGIWGAQALGVESGVAPTPAAAGEPVRTLSLDDAYDRALATDQTIQTALVEVRKADLLPWSALTRMGPILTGNAVYTKPKETLSTPVGFPVIAETEGASVTFQQPLLDLTVFAAYRNGKLSAQAARLSERFTARTVLFGVAAAYYNVLKQQQIVAVDRQTLALAEEQRTLAQRRFDVGEAIRTDVLRAEVSVAQAQRALTEAEDALRLAFNVLSNILNFGSEQPLQVIEPAPGAPSPQPLEQRVDQAYQQREDLQVSKLAIAQNVEKHREVLARYAPRLLAQWSNAWISPELFAQRNDFWTATIAIQLPLFQGGQREIDLRTTKDDITQAQLKYENLHKTIEVEVKTAWLRVHTLTRTLETLRAEVAAAEKNYHDLVNQYRVGAATSLDVQSALNELNTARTDLSAQTYDYQVALRDLELRAGVFQQQRAAHAEVTIKDVK